MKKLTLLIAMLMATSAWADIVSLSCNTDSIVLGGDNQYGDFRLTVRLDTKKLTATVENRILNYKIKNNPDEIFFYYDDNVTRTDYILNRINGLLKVDVLPRLKDRPWVEYEYQCQKVYPLF